MYSVGYLKLEQRLFDCRTGDELVLVIADALNDSSLFVGEYDNLLLVARQCLAKINFFNRNNIPF